MSGEEIDAVVEGWEQGMRIEDRQLRLLYESPERPALADVAEGYRQLHQLLSAIDRKQRGTRQRALSWVVVSQHVGRLPNGLFGTAITVEGRGGSFPLVFERARALLREAQR